MAAFQALKAAQEAQGVIVTRHTGELLNHETRIGLCEDYDRDQKAFFAKVRRHVTKWGMAIFGAIMATGLIDNKAAHVVGAFIHGLWGQP